MQEGSAVTAKVSAAPTVTSKLENLLQRIDAISGQICCIERLAGTDTPTQSVEGVQEPMPMGSFSDWADRAETRLVDISARIGEINDRL